MMQFTNRIGHSLVWVSGPVLWLGDAAAAPPPHLVAPPSPRVALNNPPPSHPRNSEPRTHGSSAAKSRARGHPTQIFMPPIFLKFSLRLTNWAFYETFDQLSYGGGDGGQKKSDGGQSKSDPRSKFPSPHLPHSR